MNTVSEYDQTIEWLYNLHLFGIKLGLKKVQKVLEYLGNPQDKLKIIHIGGTNGKGSVCTMLGSILASAGYRVGINTSPHLSEFTERISINNQEISKDDVVKYAKILKEIRERINNETDLGYATYFEVVTAMALKYFADSDVDFVVLEVGLGGKFDATNVVRPIVTVLTNIDLDHTEHLGNTLTSVAENKAGIIKPGSPVITSNYNNEILDVILKTCETQISPCYRLGQDFNYNILDSSVNGLRFDYLGLNHDYSDLQVPFIGVHQSENAALALGALEILIDNLELDVPEDKIRLGLKALSWPGRLEIMQRSPLVLLDGAHNPAGAKALFNALEMFEYNRLILVFGCSEEKNISEILQDLIQEADKIVITEADIRRAAKPDQILAELKDYSIKKEVKIPVSEAVFSALEEADETDLVCIFGSLFVVGEARELWFKRNEDEKAQKKHRIHY